MSWLNYHTVPKVDVRRALDIAIEAIGPCTVFFSSPSSFDVVSVDGGITAIPSSVFAFRAFSAQGEVRWELNVSDLGDAVVVRLSPERLSSIHSVELYSEPVERQYLCWGSVVSLATGGVLVGSSRTSEIFLPVRAVPGDVVVLESRECRAASADADGNVFVIDELLVGFVVGEDQ